MPAPSAAGELIRDWRRLRGRSQLELALDIGVSQRHLSFVESGRSAPGRTLLVALAQALELPLRERNALLLAGGFAPAWADPPWEAAEMRMLDRALQRLLRQHEPYPALVLDRHWNVLRTNDAAPRLFGHFVDLARRPKPRNLLHLVFDPEGLRPFIDDWESVARSLLQRVGREAVHGVLDERTRALVAELQAWPGAADLDAGAAPSAGPVIPITLRDGGTLLRYFSMVATVGTPQVVAAQELRVESMFPADEATEAWHLADAA